MAPDNGSNGILVVDDEESLIYVWRRFFEKEGIGVDFADDGRKALDLINAKDYQVIFSDLNLPSLGGAEVLRLARQKDPLVCINIVTGAASIEGAVSCMQMGACDYIAKPFDAFELVVKARRCLKHYAHKKEVVRLKDALTRYEEIDRLKSEFVSNVSHELRTPLFSMRGAFDLLRADLTVGADQTKFRLLSVIQNNIDRLGQLVGNILDFARLEKGTLKPEMEYVSLLELAQETMDSLAPLFLQREVSAIAVKNLSQDIKIEADPSQMRQIMTNLLGNAVKFTPSGGRVGIEFRDKDDMLEMIVWDTGIGVALDKQNKIFERFYQVDGSLTRDAGGSGIGLAIVKGIIDLHGGAVWIESEVGQGSRFHVVLPRRQRKGESRGS